MHEFIGYIQRIASFAICFIALLSHHHAPFVHKCRPQCSGTDTEEAFSPYLYYALLQKGKIKKRKYVCVHQFYFFENFALISLLMFHMKHQAAQGQNTGARMR